MKIRKDRKITIPEFILEGSGLRPGDRITLIPRRNVIEIVKVDEEWTPQIRNLGKA